MAATTLVSQEDVRLVMKRAEQIAWKILKLCRISILFLAAIIMIFKGALLLVFFHIDPNVYYHLGYLKCLYRSFLAFRVVMEGVFFSRHGKYYTTNYYWFTLKYKIPQGTYFNFQFMV
jgi:Na+-driven multidrug efflux pump